MGRGGAGLGQDQVLWNQRWGSMWRVAGSGPRLYAVMRIDMASALASSFAYCELHLHQPQNTRVIQTRLTSMKTSQ